MIFELLAAVVLSPLWLIINVLPSGPWTIGASFGSMWDTLVSLASPLGLFVNPGVVNAMIVANAIVLPIMAILYLIKYIVRVVRS